MCSLMHVKAIGTKKSEILAKITFLGIFGQILPKAPIVYQPAYLEVLLMKIIQIWMLHLQISKWIMVSTRWYKI